MLNNYLKIALRNLQRSPAYAFINVFGLVLGITCCLLIGLYVQDELSFDRFHEKGDRIFRVSQQVTQPDAAEAVWAWTGGGLAPDFEQDFPQAEAIVRFHQQPGIVQHEPEGDTPQSFRETYILFTDPNVFEVFTFPLVQGHPATALQDPTSIVITESTATKYFGEEDAIGKTLLYGNRPYTVRAIAEDVPPNSHLRFDFLLPMSAFKVMYGMGANDEFGSYWWPSVWTYVLLPNAETAEALAPQMADFSKRHRDSDEAPYYIPLLEPLYDIHLLSEADPGGAQQIPGTSGDMATVRIFGAIALAVLLLACINFMNLATARSARRTREVGVRKTVGARRTQLIFQFLGESTLLSLLALVLAVGLVELLLPAFNDLAARDLEVRYTENATYWLGLLALVLTTGVAAGLYPALYLSGFRPVQVLKGTFLPQGGARFRKVLVVVQFAVSIFLIAGTAIAFLQLRYLQTARLGFDDEQLVTVRLQNGIDFTTLQQAWQAQSAVEEVVVTSTPPGVGRGSFIPYLVGPYDAPDEDRSNIGHQMVDYGYFEMLGVDIVAGRSFSTAFRADEGVLPEGENQHFHLYERGYIINEAAARHNGWTPEEALGQQMRLYTFENGTYFTDLRGTVVGVVEDFHHSSLHEEIGPMAFSPAQSPLGTLGNFALIKVGAGDVRTTMATLRDVWERVAPGAPFEAFFLRDELNSMYVREARLSKIIGAFAGLGILIACLGLFGLAAYAAEQRTKEIGIRKVLGATVPGIVGLLSRNFLALVLIAAVVAVPLAYFVMERWLEGFAYRIAVSPLLLAGVVVLALGVAFATVGFQAVRAARIDPAKSLRYE